MFRVIILSILLLALACGSSTGPSGVYRSQVSIISTSTGSVVADIELNAGFCRSIHVSSDGGYAYLPSQGDAAVIQIDCTSQSVIGTLDLGSSTYYQDLCLNNQGTELYALTSEMLFIVDIPSLIVTDSIELGWSSSYLVTVQRPGTNLVYLSGPSSPTLVADVKLCEMVDTLSHYSMNMVFSESGNELYISESRNLVCIDPDTDQEIMSLDTGILINDICSHSGSGLLYVSCFQSDGVTIESAVFSVNRNTFNVVDSLDTPDGASNICYVPGQNQLYIESYGEFDIIVADLPGLDPVGGIDIDTGLNDMAADPSGDFVYCSIYYSSLTD